MNNGKRVAAELKAQIINRIKNDGITVAQAAKDHGLHETTIYSWIAQKVEGQPSFVELIRSLYYRPKLPARDWKLKCEIEMVLREQPGYGSPRISLELKRNHKPIERVMHLFGIKAYRRRAKRYRKPRPIPRV